MLYEQEVTCPVCGLVNAPVDMAAQRTMCCDATVTEV